MKTEKCPAVPQRQDNGVASTLWSRPLTNGLAALCLIFAVSFAAPSLALFLTLADVSRRQADATELQIAVATALERAYVHVHQIRLVGSLVADTSACVVVEYENSGRTPANKLSVTTGTDIVLRSQLSRDLSEATEADDDQEDLSGEILPPGVIRSRREALPPKLPRPLAKGDGEAIQSGRKYWLVWATFSYHDEFQKRHFSVEPFVYNPDQREFEPYDRGWHDD